MFILQGIFAGIIATLLFDLYQISLAFAYNTNKSKWNLIGRYFFGLLNKRFKRDTLSDDEIIRGELIIGYVVHYIIGSSFGILYVVLNILFYHQPSIILAIFIGFITVLGGWCIIMPFAFDMGFFASKKMNKNKY